MKIKRNRAFAAFLSAILSVMLILSAMPLTAAAESADVTIATAAELRQFAEDVNNGNTYEGKTVTLTADVALGGESNPWTPIGTGSAPFKGTFDGGKHVVSGLYIASGSSVGLFGSVNGGTVKNLVVRGEVTGSSNVGGVVGSLTAGTVENCGNEANVTGGSNVGGVVGAVNDASTVRGCYNAGSVSGTTGYIGGVTGQHWRAGTVENCYNVGAVSGPGTVGGVTGGHKAASPALTNCYNAGQVTDTTGNSNNIGAVLGAGRKTVTNCYYLTGTGTDPKSGVTKVTAIDPAALGDAFAADTDAINGGHPILSWQAKQPDLIIGTYEQLKSFADRVNGGETFDGKWIRLDVNIYLGGESNPWTPIGASKAPFKGTFDGGYHVVSGLYIASGSTVGLFGCVNGGTVKNLVVRGEVTGSSNVAGVVGNLKAGTVENCGNEANVTGGSSVGGVVAYVDGTCTVRGCYNAGDVLTNAGNFTGYYMGGVTGQHWGTATVENCYNVGTVSGSATVGGVTAGFKRATITMTNCYNAGTVTDTTGSANNIGAVLGAAGTPTITNCYYLTGTGTDTKSGVTEVTAIDPAALGDAFAADDPHPVLTWESKISTDAPVRPAFIEKTELSAQLAAYIKSAVNSTKKNGGISGTLLGSDKFTAGASSTATDWMALAMGRFGYFDGEGYHFLIDDGTGYADYLAAMKAYMEATYAANNGILHSAKATEWHRAVVAIAALGGDPTAFGMYQGAPIDLIADGSYACKVNGGPGAQGINGWIWGLLAMDTGMYSVPDDAQYTRETFIKEILRMQLNDGGWVLGGFGSSSDVDITAMTIQALAPYYNDDTVYTYTNASSKTEVSKTVRECVNEALDRLGAMQNANGGYSSWGTDNVESVAQVVVALCALGIDPATDERFVTDSGKTLLDGILRFRLSDGGFCHVLNGGWNSMANDQATYALVAYWRQQNGMRALYDMRGSWTAAEKSAIQAAIAAIDSVGDPTAADYKAQLKSALAKFRAVPEDERRYVSNYNQLATTIHDLIGSEAALDTDAPYIVSISVTQAPDKTEYYEDEWFDATGMIVTAQYSDSSTAALTDYKLSAGKLSLTTDTVYVTCGPLKASVAVTVREKLPWDGAGTAESPYLIRTAEELKALAERVNSGKSTTGQYFALAANIDLSDCDPWTSIGSSTSRQFDGQFDGQGYVIDNLYGNKGLFGYAGTNAVIQNVGVASGEIGRDNLSFVGAIVGWSNGADILNCWNGADIISIGWSGGIVGTVRDGGESVIRGCYNIGSVTNKYDSVVGGIVGHLSTSGHGVNVSVTISDCYNAGTITAKDCAGGIVGRMQDGHTVKNCYNIGQVRVNGDNILDGAGAIVGMATSDNEITNCYYDPSVTPVGIASGSGQAIAKTAAELKSAEMLTLLGSGFKADRYAKVNNGYPLLSWQPTAAADAIDNVAAQIDAIGEVTPDRADAIHAARAAYDALPEADQALVPNADVLQAAEAALAALQPSQPGDGDQPGGGEDQPGGGDQPGGENQPGQPDTPKDPSEEPATGAYTGVTLYAVWAAFALSSAVIFSRKKKKA